MSDMKDYLDKIEQDEQKRLEEWRAKPSLEKDIGIDYNSVEDDEKEPSLLHLTEQGIFRACDTPANGWCSYVIQRDGEWQETITIKEYITFEEITAMSQRGDARKFIPCDKCKSIIKDDFELE